MKSTSQTEDRHRIIGRTYFVVTKGDPAVPYKYDFVFETNDINDVEDFLKEQGDMLYRFYITVEEFAKRIDDLKKIKRVSGVDNARCCDIGGHKHQDSDWIVIYEHNGEEFDYNT